MNDVLTRVSTEIKERNLLEILESKSTMQAGNIGCIECIREMIGRVIHYREKRGDFADHVDIKDHFSLFSFRIEDNLYTIDLP